MIIINKDTIETLIKKLDDTSKDKVVYADVKNMLEIKQTLLWRADAGTCCGSLESVASFIARETIILENILVALEKGDKSEAIRLLQEYKQILETNNEPSQSRHC